MKWVQWIAVAGVALACQSTPAAVSQVQPSPTTEPAALTVTLYNCKMAYPCERFTNTTTRDIELTVENTYQKQTVTVPAGLFIEMQMDASDNR